MKKIITAICLIFLLPLLIQAQSGNDSNKLEVLSIKSTGETTGHIADIMVKNNSRETIFLLPQTFFIPSDGRFQSYVGRIPKGISIPPGATVKVPVNGYCTDVNRPPVPIGIDMPPITEWIPVGDPDLPGGPYVAVLPTPPAPKFNPDNLYRIKASPGFHTTNSDPEGEITSTWPTTNNPVNGTLDINRYPKDFAATVVAVVEEVEETTDQMVNSGTISTPFSGDTAREKESVTQQTIWVAMGGLTGNIYEKEDFSDNVRKQFENTTGTSVATLPKKDQEKIDAGVDDFWNSFMAVGAEAKVFKTNNEMQIFPHLDKDELKKKLEGESSEGQNEEEQIPGEEVPDDDRPPMAPPAETACICDSLNFNLSVRRENSQKQGRGKRLTSIPFTQMFTFNSDEKGEIDIDVDDWKEGDFYVLVVNNIEVYCHCQNGLAGNADCDFYADSSMDGTKNEVELEEIEDARKNVEVENTDDQKKGDKIIKASKEGTRFSFKVLPKKDNKKENEGKVQIELCITADCFSKECVVGEQKSETGCEKCITIKFNGQ